MTIDTQHLRDLIRQACPLPWTLATSNSWRRIVDPYHVPVVSPCNQRDGHPDLCFPAGPEGPTARLLIEGINALPELLDIIDAANGQVAEYARIAERTRAESEARIDAQAAQVTRWQRVAESAEARAQAAADEIERLQRIIDSRPAINAGLPETYIIWSQSIYAMEAAHAAETRQ